MQIFPVEREKTHRVLGVIAAVGVSFALFTYLLAMIFGVIAIFYTPLQIYLVSVYVHLPILLDLPTPIYSNLWVYSIGIVIIFAVCFVAGIRNENGVLWGLRSLSRGTAPSGLPNWLVIMPLGAASLFLIVVLLTLLLSVGGIQTGGLPAPQNPTSAANFFASVIYAPITEEFSLRILPIGFFVALRALVQVLDSPRITGENSIWSIIKIAVKSVILGFFSPEKAKALVGLRRVATHGFRGIQWWEWTLLFVTSIIFGLLHVLLGPWDTGKAVTASLSGFGLGLAYIVYGAYADILVHWFFNFYTLVFSLNVVLGIDVYSGGLLDFALAMDILIVLLQIFLGIVGIIVGIIWWQDKRSKGQQRTYTQGYIPSFT